MSRNHCGIAERPIADTPIAVFDFETTGLYPGYDRVIEVSVIRLDPGQPNIVGALNRATHPLGADCESCRHKDSTSIVAV